MSGVDDPPPDPDPRAVHPLDDLAERVHLRLVADPGTVGRSGDPAGDRSARPPLDRVVARSRIRELVRTEAPLLDEGTAARVCDLVLARVVGLGPLEPLLDDPQVTDVMVNGDGRVWIDRAGRLEATGLVLDERVSLHLIERVLAPLGRHVDRSAPIVDARLHDGSRVHAVVRPLAVDGPCLTIRRFGARPIRLDEVATPGVVDLLTWAVGARLNLVVSGGAGAGKTTLLNALAAAIPPGERIVTIEDAAELRLPGEHVVRLESRPASAEGVGEVRIRDLVRAALRMRPDRIVVGEVRSGEALDMLQALNTGHEGSLSTCHANGPLDALRRLETMVLMGDVELPHAVVREQVVSAVDLVVHVARGADGVRRVTAVAEVADVRPGGGLATRPLATSSGVVDLPQRPIRSSAAGPPRAAWLGR
jgi:pilus assembly protein CpaF